jgi:hypothetical protein
MILPTQESASTLPPERKKNEENFNGPDGCNILCSPTESRRSARPDLSEVDCGVSHLERLCDNHSLSRYNNVAADLLRAELRVSYESFPSASFAIVSSPAFAAASSFAPQAASSFAPPEVV